MEQQTDDLRPALALQYIGFEIAADLGFGRIGMALQRRRLSADLAAMRVIRTSLSMMGFSFTIGQFLLKFRETGIPYGSVIAISPSTTAGTALPMTRA